MQKNILMFDGALFDEYKNFAFKFPEPQYLGAKANLLPWISRFLPDNVETALDAFAGSQSVSYHQRFPEFQQPDRQGAHREQAGKAG